MTSGGIVAYRDCGKRRNELRVHEARSRQIERQHRRRRLTGSTGNAGRTSVLRTGMFIAAVSVVE